ncbi:MAG TPA: NUDIX domain-containing protein, partial [Acidobacteriota bacterium]
NSEDRLLLQKRAKTKYHSGGLWSNTCCSHPQPGESIGNAARRRLKQEMGFTCALEKVYELTYRAQVQHDLVEHEYDHIFVGKFDGDPKPNPVEVEDWKWMTLQQLSEALAKSPESYTHWLGIMMSDSDLLSRLK